MPTVSKLYTAMALADLSTLTEYEAWLLEAVYEIVDQRLAFREVDELVYPPSGESPNQMNYIVGNIVPGDWRPGFLKAGAPLVFVTTFKLLDMLIEWVLVLNGKRSTHRFDQKITALKGPVFFPVLIETRTWLRERLIALYEHLEPLRGTIIHARHFKTAEGTLQVSSSKKGTIGPIITFSEGDLRNLALALVSLVRYLEGSWNMDIFQEKQLRYVFDELVHLHKLPLMGQLPPGFLTVRLYVPCTDPIEFDISRIKRDVAEKRKGQDVIFDVRIIVLARDSARAYLIPSDQLQISGPKLSKTHSELASYAVPLPVDVDSAVAVCGGAGFGLGKP
jgi:hypothetical protein